MEGTEPYWLQGMAGLEISPREGFPERAEVVVVGGGLVGVCTAYWLAKAGIEVVLLEKGQLAGGASGRNAGFLLAGTAEFYSRLVGSLGPEAAAQVWGFTVESNRLLVDLIREHGIACQYRREGSLALASSSAELEELEASVRLLNEAGFESELLDRGQLADLLPMPLPERFLGGRYRRSDGVLNPAQLVRGLAQAAVREGAKIFPSTEVLQMREAASDRVEVTTDRGPLAVVIVVLATNAWSPLLHPFFPDLVYPVRGQMLATAPFPRRIFRGGLSTNHGYDYWRQTEAGNIIIGGFRWTRQDMDVGYYAQQITSDIQTQLYGFLTEVFPLLQGIEVTHRWAGIMGFTEDGLPLIGPLPGRHTVLAAAGFNGHGLAFATLTGKVLAELISEGESSWPLGLFAPRRFLK